MKERRWKVVVVPLKSCGKIKCFWRTPEGKRRSLGWWARMAAKGKVPDERQHYIHMLARFHVPVMQSLTAVLLRREGAWVAVDGNYHLIAALSVKVYRYGKLKCPLSWAGLVIPAKEKFGGKQRARGKARANRRRKPSS